MPEGYVATTDTITARKTGKSYIKDLKIRRQQHLDSEFTLFKTTSQLCQLVQSV